jgi:hypothetical protein
MIMHNFVHSSLTTEYVEKIPSAECLPSVEEREDANETELCS